jgi:hypothetical protein
VTSTGAGGVNVSTIRIRINRKHSTHARAQIACVSLWDACNWPESRRGLPGDTWAVRVSSAFNMTNAYDENTVVYCVGLDISNGARWSYH